MKEKKPKIEIYLDAETKAQFKAQAAARKMPLSLWAIQAMFAYERRGQGKTPQAQHWASGWRRDIPCHVCKGWNKTKYHDPMAEHGLSNFDDEEQEMGKVWK